MSYVLFKHIFKSSYNKTVTTLIKYPLVIMLVIPYILGVAYLYNDYIFPEIYLFRIASLNAVIPIFNVMYLTMFKVCLILTIFLYVLLQRFYQKMLQKYVYYPIKKIYFYNVIVLIGVLFLFVLTMPFLFLISLNLSQNFVMFFVFFLLLICFLFITIIFLFYFFYVINLLIVLCLKKILKNTFIFNGCSNTVPILLLFIVLLVLNTYKNSLNVILFNFNSLLVMGTQCVLIALFHFISLKYNYPIIHTIKLDIVLMKKMYLKIKNLALFNSLLLWVRFFMEYIAIFGVYIFLIVFFKTVFNEVDYFVVVNMCIILGLMGQGILAYDKNWYKYVSTRLYLKTHLYLTCIGIIFGMLLLWISSMLLNFMFTKALIYFVVILFVLTVTQYFLRVKYVSEDNRSTVFLLVYSLLMIILFFALRMIL